MNQKTEQKKDHWFLETCILCIAVLLINLFVVRLAVVEGRSMYPTLEDGEYMLLWQLAYTPEAGDIVVIDTDEDWFSRDVIVKRVIAVEGQTVSIDYDSNTVCVDGRETDEPYINLTEDDPMLPTGTEGSSAVQYTIPDGCIFVMGDNRNHSADSRSTRYGMIPERCVMGKVVHVFG